MKHLLIILSFLLLISPLFGQSKKTGVLYLYGVSSGVFEWKTFGDPDAQVIYKGEIFIGKPHGTGRLTFPDGTMYVGEFKNGQHHGKGTLTYGKGESEGDEYVGEWKNGKQHGQGTMTLASGSKSVGEWENGKQHGQAILTSSDGIKWGEGEYREDALWNFTLYYDNGIMRAKWVNGVKQPTLYYNPETLKYQTKFISTQYPVYVGEARNGVPHGQGTFSLVGYKYVGEWKDGLKHGHGTETAPEYQNYVGEFKEGKWHGQGILTLADGRRYKGDFKEGILSSGILTLSDGRIFVGFFKDAKPWKGTLHDKNVNLLGTFSYGIWKPK